MKAFVFCWGPLLSLGVFTQAWAQNSWSDSRPALMTLINPNCPLKVKGLSGEWATFKDKIPVGRSVIAAINPRQPNVVFFQLKKESPFTFAAPRTCFEGEENWSEAAEKGQNLPPKPKRWFVYLSPHWLNESPKLTLTDTGKTYPLSAKFMSGTAGYVWEATQKSWSIGGGLYAGLGTGSVSSASDSVSYSNSGVLSMWGGLQGLAYHHFNEHEQAIGFETQLGFIRSPWKTNIVNYVVSPTNTFQWGLLGGWRFYLDDWLITPKVGLHRSFSNLQFEIQLGYFWDGK